MIESAGLSGVSLLALIFFARLLSPVEIGIGMIALGAVQVLMVPVEILFQDVLIQRAEVEDAHFDTAFAATLVLGMILFVLGWACSGVLARFVGIGEIGPVFCLMNLSLLPMAFGTIIAARQRREMDFRSLALRSLIGRFGSAAVGIGVALYGGGVWTLVVQQVLLVTFAAVVLWILADKRPRLRFSRRHFREMIGFGLRSVLVMSANVAVARVFMTLVGAWLGAASAGYINIAFRAIDMLRDAVAVAVVQLALPLFGRFRGNATELQRGYIEAVSFTCLIGFPMFAGLSACGPEIVSLLFGPQWQPSVPYVILFGLLVIPYFTRLYAMPCMAAVDQPQAALPGLVATLVFIIAGMATVGRWSLMAAATIWAVRLLVGLPIDALLLRHVSGISLRNQLRGVGFPLLATVSMLAAVNAERVLVLGGLSQAVRMGAIALLGVIVYGGTMLLLDRPTVLRLLDFARSGIARTRQSPIGDVQLP